MGVYSPGVETPGWRISALPERSSRELQPWFHGDARVLLKDGSVLTWSRRYRGKVEGVF
jgi:hypothetical protein